MRGPTACDRPRAPPRSPPRLREGLLQLQLALPNRIHPGTHGIGGLRSPAANMSAPCWCRALSPVGRRRRNAELQDPAEQHGCRRGAARRARRPRDRQLPARPGTGSPASRLFTETRVWVMSADHPAAWQELTLDRLGGPFPSDHLGEPGRTSMRSAAMSSTTASKGWSPAARSACCRAPWRRAACAVSSA